MFLPTFRPFDERKLKSWYDFVGLTLATNIMEQNRHKWRRRIGMVGRSNNGYRVTANPIYELWLLNFAHGSFS